jgi:hypothetical protein
LVDEHTAVAEREPFEDFISYASYVRKPRYGFYRSLLTRQLFREFGELAKLGVGERTGDGDVYYHLRRIAEEALALACLRIGRRMVGMPVPEPSEELLADCKAKESVT